MVNRDGTVAEWIGPPANVVEHAPADSGPGCAGSCFSMPPPSRSSISPTPVTTHYL